jgi:hypothetical protein
MTGSMYEPIPPHPRRRAVLSAALTIRFFTHIRDAQEAPDFGRLLDLGYSVEALELAIERVPERSEERVMEDAMCAFEVELTQATTDEAMEWLEEFSELAPSV